MKKYLLIIFSVFFIYSCDEDSVSSFTYDAEVDETYTYNVTTQIELVVLNTNGSINITGSDTTTNLYCFVTKKVESKVSESDAQSHLSDIDITIQDNSDYFNLEVDNPNSDDRELRDNT